MNKLTAFQLMVLSIAERMPRNDGSPDMPAQCLDSALLVTEDQLNIAMQESDEELCFVALEFTEFMCKGDREIERPTWLPEDYWKQPYNYTA